MAFFQRPDAGDGGSKTWTSEAAPPAADRDAARRAFLRMVSHELRTPLNSIIGFADILHGQLYGPLGSPEYVEYAGIIRDSGARLLHLFNNVLELIRLEGGGGFSPAPEPVQPWLDEAVMRRRAAAEARGVGLRLRPSGEKLSAAFDPKGLLTCLDHLIGNAVDFTAAGDAVEISARRDGAYAWGLHEHTADPERIVEWFMVESWAEHLRQHHRVSHADADLQDEVVRWHIGPQRPEVHHFLAL